MMARLKETHHVASIQPIGNDFMLIHRKDGFQNKKMRPVTAAVISTKQVTDETLKPLLETEQEFEFVTNLPKQGIWTGAAIDLADFHNLGWGGMGDLMSAMAQDSVEGFQRKEYSFVMRGLAQHSKVESIDRIYDRLINVNRYGLPPLTTVLLNEYELTAEHIRNARDIYGKFKAILRTNPNGGPTKNALSVAHELGADIFQWGEFLGRLNKE